MFNANLLTGVFMTTQTKQSKNIADIIKVLHGGVDFYQEASAKLSSDKLKSVFEEMIDNKQEAIDVLQPCATNEQGENEYDSDCCVEIRKLYTHLIAKLSLNKAHTYVSQLEEVEDKVLDLIDKALSEKPTEPCLTILHSVRTGAQTMHDEMKAYQKATA
jgi:uncharacterized protein (TIGR02284 family)